MNEQMQPDDFNGIYSMKLYAVCIVLKNIICIILWSGFAGM